MLTHEELVALERSLRSTDVLSVYLGVDTQVADDAAWTASLNEALTRAGRTLGGMSRGERAAFDRAIEQLLRRFPPVSAGAPRRSWVAFVTPDEVRYTRTLPVPLPTHARWGRGIGVAPYLRALKQDRPVTLVALDSRAATLYRYRYGVIETVDLVQTPEAVTRLARPDGERAGRRRPGKRGSTGAIETDRHRLPPFQRLADEVCVRIARSAGHDGWVVVGGAHEAAKTLVRMLGAHHAGRLHEASDLHVDSSERDVRDVAERAASLLHRARHARLVDAIVEARGASGRGALGLDEVRAALLGRQVGELLVTSAFVDRHAEDAEMMVRAAFDQGARAEHVAGEAAERLDAMGGVGTRLRFALRSAGDVAETAARGVA